jgi:hypothetical protein
MKDTRGRVGRRVGGLTPAVLCPTPWLHWGIQVQQNIPRGHRGSQSHHAVVSNVFGHGEPGLDALEGPGVATCRHWDVLVGGEARRGVPHVGLRALRAVPSFAHEGTPEESKALQAKRESNESRTKVKRKHEKWNESGDSETRVKRKQNKSTRS